MPARAAVYELLSQDPELSTIVQKVIAANAVDTPPADVFVVLKWDPEQVAFKTWGTTNLQIWVHDTSRDYGKIDLALRRIREILSEAVHARGEDGWILTEASWSSEGPDLFDAGYGTVTRYADFSTVSRYDSTGAVQTP